MPRGSWAAWAGELRCDSVALFSPIYMSLLFCLAATRFSGSLEAISVETLDSVQKAVAVGDFVSRTHRGFGTVQGNATPRLMAIQVCPSWVCFAIFNFFRRGIRRDFTRVPAATSRRIRGIDWTGRSRMREADNGVSSLGPSRLANRLHASELTKTARTIPANGEAHIISMVQVEPRRPLRPSRNPGPAEGCEGTGDE